MRARRTNSDIERHYFERFRKAYPLPEGTVAYGDKPDITLTGVPDCLPVLGISS